VVPLLAESGRRAIAVDLPGHGVSARFPAAYLQPGQPGLAEEVSPLRELTLDTVAEAVVEVVRSLGADPRASRPIVLVGHSLGGAVITRTAQLVPDEVDHLIYLAAVVPTRLATTVEYFILPEAGPPNPNLYVGNPASIGASRINPRTTDPTYRELLRTTFYGDLSTEDFLAYANALTPDQPTGIASAAVGTTADRWGTVPRTYIKTLQDRAIAPALQQGMIDEADQFTPDNRFNQITIDSSHSPFASQPEQLTKTIVSLR
jgi:pimeloyl-ACP methyl ester carboxylesterase